MKIPDEIVKLIKWELYPKSIPGGQSCGIIPTGIKLICEEVGFEVLVNNYRSQIKNKELAITLFELYLMEIKVI